MTKPQTSVSPSHLKSLEITSIFLKKYTTILENKKPLYCCIRTMRNCWTKGSRKMKLKKNSTAPNKHEYVLQQNREAAVLTWDCRWTVGTVGPPLHQATGLLVRKTSRSDKRNKLSSSHPGPPTSGTPSNNCCSCPQVEAISTGSLQEKISHARYWGYPRDKMKHYMEKGVSIIKKKKSTTRDFRN